MDTKLIVEKALKGEDYSSLIKDMGEDEKSKVILAIRDAADAEAKAKLKEVSGLREAERALKEKKDGETKDVLETFRKEQLEKAKKKFYSDPDFPLTDTQKTAMEAEIVKRGVISTDSDFILEEFQRIYGYLNIGTLISDKKKAVEGAKNAQKFTSHGAGGQNSGPTGDPDKFSQPVKDLWQKVVESGHVNFTLDDAKRQYEKGRAFGSRSLS